MELCAKAEAQLGLAWPVSEPMFEARSRDFALSRGPLGADAGFLGEAGRALLPAASCLP